MEPPLHKTLGSVLRIQHLCHHCRHHLQWRLLLFSLGVACTHKNKGESTDVFAFSLNNKIPIYSCTPCFSKLYDDMPCFETALILRRHRQPAQSINRPPRPDPWKPDRTAVQCSGRCYISAEIQARLVTPIASFAGRFRTNWKLYSHLLLTDIWQSVHDRASTLQLSANISVLWRYKI